MRPRIHPGLLSQPVRDGPLATPRPSGEPILERPSPPVCGRLLYQGRQDGTTVLYCAQLLVAIYTHRKCKYSNLVYCSFVLGSPLLYLWVSTMVTRLLPPAPVSRLIMDKSLTESNGSCCLPLCIFTILSSPLLLHKLDRGTCIPDCAFLVSRKASEPASADLFSASDAFTRCDIVKARFSSPTP
jgi:hypothetical protein